MSMKANDVAIATSLLIQGYVRANGDDNKNLADAIKAIRRECHDWSENTDGTEHDVVGDLTCVRPHDMVCELINLLGPEEAKRQIDIQSARESESVS